MIRVGATRKGSAIDNNIVGASLLLNLYKQKESLKNVRKRIEETVSHITVG